jgi:hypothetical protein
MPIDPERTARLKLPYIMPSQAQKHVTHNEALRMIDALVQPAVLDRDRSAPPAAPAEGDRHIVAAGATGEWAGRSGQIAAFQDGAWMFYAPAAGWQAWVAAEANLFIHDGSGWAPLATGGMAGEVPSLGINATADAVNRLAVSSEATLFDHAGTDHRMKVNKAAAGDTASFLFQTDYSGRAEFGLAGSDDFSVKVSADGSAWKTALAVAAASGKVAFPQGLAAPLAVAQGGTGVATGIEALGSLGLRYGVGNIDNNTVATVNFGSPVYGSVLFLVGNTTAVPLGTVFARMAPSPQLVPLGLAGGTLGAFNTALSGTTGPAGQVNMAALDGGLFQIENRRGYTISYTLYLLR